MASDVNKGSGQIFPIAAGFLGTGGMCSWSFGWITSLRLKQGEGENPKPHSGGPGITGSGAELCVQLVKCNSDSSTNPGISDSSLQVGRRERNEGREEM